MIAPCEIAAKSVVPAIKALLAKELVEKHNLKQEEAARLLGISQSAVSKYTRKVRGYAIRIGEIREIESLIDEMTSLLINGKYQRSDFLTFFCQTCTEIRKKGLMCIFCEKTDPNIKAEECRFCLTTFKFSKIKRV